jgi:protein-L-isoaspartate(D-aspartate) O-methyltransferase
MLLPPGWPLAWLGFCVAASGLGAGDKDAPGPDTDPFDAARARMVTDQIASRGVRDPRVLAAMREVARHLFVTPGLRGQAYDDYPLLIGYDQTISQPYIVALMTELARPAPSDRALEVGTGCGYQSAVLSRVVGHLFSVEINEDLSRQAAARLSHLGYANVTVAHADGYKGWASEAPFDIVIVTAAPTAVPRALIDQLAVGGRLIIPVGLPYAQELLLIEKQADGRTRTKTVAPVTFVPMVHEGDRR